MNTAQIYYTWGGIRKTVQDYIDACEHCQIKKHPQLAPPLTPIIPQHKRSRLVFDLTEKEIDNYDMKYILVVINSFTKMIWTFALPSKHTGPICKFLYETFKNLGYEIYQSDNGGEFISKEIEAIIEKLGGTFVHGSPRHPQSQGVVERVNGTLKKKLNTILDLYGGDWSRVLQKATLHYNTTVHSVTRVTPYKVRFTHQK